MIIALIALLVSVSVNVVAALLLRKATSRLLQFDELYEMLLDDMDTNVKHFEELRQKPLLSNAQEVIQAHKNMMLMRERLDEFVIRINEMSGKKVVDKENS